MTTNLSSLLHSIYEIKPAEERTILGLTLDSREVKPGYLFFAFSGLKQDGKLFINDAFAKGASVVLVDAESEHSLRERNDHHLILTIPNLKHKMSQIAARFYDHPADRLKMIGVTGTNGKTSCSHFIAHILQKLNQTCGIIGTLGYGFYDDLSTGTLTTPDAISLQKILADLQVRGATHISMEVSSHSLDQGRVNDLPFSIGIFTNLTRDHLDYHGTMEAYGLAKKKLFDFPLQYAVINYDDEFGRSLLQNVRHKTIAYSIQNNADVYIKDLILDTNGMKAEVITPWGQGLLKSHLLGRFNLSNLLAVLSTLCLLDLPFSKVLQAISELTPVSGRMQSFGGKTKPLVVVDYSHTPDSLEKALIALREHSASELYCVFGCGGDRDRGKRPLMANIAEKLSDHVIVTNDNPRTEDAKAIVDDILAGFSNLSKVKIQYDRSKAILDAIQYAKPGDCVLIAGKGAETYQLIGDVKFPFSDIDEVRKCFNHS